jgi:four helix bundle protein
MENIILEKSYNFALTIIKLVHLLPKETTNNVLGKQLVRSGTSIGANIEEAQSASSKKDFINKIIIAKKEARETKYWLRLLIDSKIISQEKTIKTLSECEEILCILTAITKTSTKVVLN